MCRCAPGTGLKDFEAIRLEAMATRVEARGAILGPLISEQVELNGGGAHGTPTVEELLQHSCVCFSPISLYKQKRSCSKS